MRCYCKRLCLYANFFVLLLTSILTIMVIRKNRFRHSNLNFSSSDDHRMEESNYWLSDVKLFSSLTGQTKKMFKNQIHQQLQHDELMWPSESSEILIGDHDDQKMDFLILERRKELNLIKFNNFLIGRRSKQTYGRDLNNLMENINKIYISGLNEQERKLSESCSLERKKRLESNNSKDSSWNRFYNQITTCDLYGQSPAAQQIINDLLADMSSVEISALANMVGGTQVKLDVAFKNGHRALMKPMRFDRNYERHPNQFYFTDFERHNAEIASFHLDKLLGYRKALPTVGRLVNLTDIWPKSDKNLSNLFFYSPAKNLCFVGTCKYYCDTTHAICGKPDVVEVSVQVFLPKFALPVERMKSPFARTYSKKKQLALWQQDHSYCDVYVKNSTKARYLLNMIDVAILDFLTGNQDRHHFDFLTMFDMPHFFIHLDNGRAFGRSDFDDIDILAPLTQCCLIRPSTLAQLLKFFNGPDSLAVTLNESMSKDPLEPILADKHLIALERRLEIILKKIHACIFGKNDGNFKEVIKNNFVPRNI